MLQKIVDKQNINWCYSFDKKGKNENGNASGMTTSGGSHGSKLYSNTSLDELHKIFRHDTWFVIRNIYERLKGIDWVKFLACDVVKKVSLIQKIYQLQIFF